MGYWDMGQSGMSFTKSGKDPASQMIWGDEPADAVADAVYRIKIAFIRDVGRMPSKVEIMEGFKFVLLDELADEPRDAPLATPAQSKVAQECGYTATGGDVGPSERQHEARMRMREVFHTLEIERKTS